MSKRIGDLTTSNLNPSDFIPFESSSSGETLKATYEDILAEVTNLITENTPEQIYETESLTNIAVGGCPINTDLNGLTFKEIVDRTYFTILNPIASISVTSPSRLRGSTTGVVLNWSVTKTTEPITSITVNGTSITPTGNSQSGTQAAVGTQSVTTTFNMNVTTATKSVNASASLTWYNNRYYGAVDTNTPDNAAITATTTNSTESKSLTATYNCTGGKYIMFAVPSRLGTLTSLKIGGFDEAYTMSVVSVTNAAGYSENYNVFIVNQIQYGSAISVTFV